MNSFGQASFEFLFGVGIVLVIFALSIFGLFGFNMQANASVDVLSKQAECNKVLALTELVQGKQGKIHSIQLAFDANVYENFIEISPVTCFSSFLLQETSLSPGTIKAEFNGVAVFVSN
ncbi:MAG: hypothetical protein ABIA76_04880 [Candidatus Diapherotrites archaeon]